MAKPTRINHNLNAKLATDFLSLNEKLLKILIPLAKEVSSVLLRIQILTGFLLSIHTNLIVKEYFLGILL